MDKQQLEAIRARDADDYAAADVLRNIRSAGNTDPELEATINMIADRRDLLAAYDALAARLASVERELALIAALQAGDGSTINGPTRDDFGRAFRMAQDIARTAMRESHD